MSNKTLLIGIDPDVDRSGFCAYRADLGQISQLTTMDLEDTFRQILDYHEDSKELGFDLIVLVEAGWNNKTNFHVKGSDNAWKSASIGSKLGENSSIGKQIIKFCEKHKIEVIAVTPKSHKINADYFKAMTKWAKRTNQEMRDAYRVIVESYRR
jgi:GTP-binding protein EngB required for normal cell division